jgi:hypothetical protein
MKHREYKEDPSVTAGGRKSVEKQQMLKEAEDSTREKNWIVT